MAPTIHLVRHAQGFHNLSVDNETMHDPDLTPLGEEQCAALSASFRHHSSVTRLVASPLRRTLHTCLNGFGKRDGAPLPIVALDLLQEISTAPCDVGSDAATLAAEFGGKVDLARVSPDWTDKGETSRFEPSVGKLTARAKQARLALRDLAGDGDDHIVVVSHGGFLHFLTDDWHGVPSGAPTGWTNCEYRSYQFVDPSGQDGEAALRETPESWQRRKGTEIPPTSTELRELRAASEGTTMRILNVKI